MGGKWVGNGQERWEDGQGIGGMWEQKEDGQKEWAGERDSDFRVCWVSDT